MPSPSGTTAVVVKLVGASGIAGPVPLVRLMLSMYIVPPSSARFGYGKIQTVWIVEAVLEKGPKYHISFCHAPPPA